MVLRDNNRRDFLKVSSAAVAATAVSWNAASYAAILAANDRVKVGVVGCGDRRPTKVDVADTKDATGVYLTSEGVKGPAVWSTRGRWCSLIGHTGSHEVPIVIFDSPRNPGYPTYWHARGYGLFPATPLGRNIFDPKQPAFNFTIENHETAFFRYRVVLYSYAASGDELNREADLFASEHK